MSARQMLAVAAALVGLTAGVAFGQEGKIGFIDSNRLRNELKEFKDAQAKLDKEAVDWKKHADSLQQAITTSETELERQRIFLSDEKRKEKESEIGLKKQELVRYNTEIYDPVAGKYYRRNVELTKPILDRINQALERLATENNYVLIFDAVNGSIAYGRKGLDLTDKLLQELAGR